MSRLRIDAAEVAELGVALAETGGDLLLLGDPAAERWALGPGDTGPAFEELVGGWRRARLVLGGALVDLGDGGGRRRLGLRRHRDRGVPVAARGSDVSGLPPLPGDPAAVRLLADRLTSSAQRLAALAGRPRAAARRGDVGGSGGRRLRRAPARGAPGARCRGPAPRGRGGPAAGARRRHGGGAASSSAPRSATTTTPSTRMPCSRTARSPSSARGPARTTPTCCSSATSSASRSRSGRVARARHAAAVERFREADRRCARALAALSVDGLADSLPYRALVGASVRRARACRPRPGGDRPSRGSARVAAVGEGVGLGADTGAPPGLRGGGCRGPRRGAALGGHRSGVAESCGAARSRAPSAPRRGSP